MNATTRLAMLMVLLVCSTHVCAADWHVSVKGDDTHLGTLAAPLRTIQQAAELAQPGDTITVHAGVYRERVNPPRGGESDSRRITYQAAPGETVVIKGSEVATGWIHERDDVWKLTLSSTFFGDFNPFADPIRGDWFDPRGRKHHTGAVYLNDDWLTEAATLDEVMLPGGAKPAWLTGTPSGYLNPQLWFAQVDGANTTIWAQFSGVDPNKELVEINARSTVFYPDQPGRDFITVRGFTMRHAATQWAPPTAEQVGLIGTHWSKGWIIENNVISHSVCSGIALGKHGDQFDNTSADTAEGYVKTIERAHAFPIPWTKERIGHHIVRNNTISHCEQTAIVGSLGSAFCTVTGNTIHDIHIRRLFSGAEMAGIKFHGAIDTVISHNHIYRCCQALWLDWMAQGTRVTGNLFHDNEDRDLFLEVDHGPCLVDNNLFLSPVSLLDVSEGSAFVHNWIGGLIISQPEPNRETPFHPAHSTTVAGLIQTRGGDNRFYYNVFVGKGKPDAGATDSPAPAAHRGGSGLWVYNDRPLPLQTGGNVYLFGASPYVQEKDAIVLPEHDPALQLDLQEQRVEFQFTVPQQVPTAALGIITSEILGTAAVSKQRYENADGSALKVDTDYLGAPRDAAHPTAGPFEKPGAGVVKRKVW